MTVKIEHDRFILESENVQDVVYLEHYMAKELDVTYGKVDTQAPDGNTIKQFRMIVAINGAEIVPDSPSN